MTIATAHDPVVAAPEPQASAARKLSRVVIASINRAEGDTGVHTHTRVLSSGLIANGVACDVVGPFGGSRKWLPIFAVRPLVLNRLNRTWSTLWHRRWHMAALRENLLDTLAQGAPADVVVAQCPVSARAALEARSMLGQRFRVVLVCHFNHSEAAEYRAKGELADSRNYQAMLDSEANVLESVDRVVYVSQWARQNVEETRGLRTRSAAVIWNGSEDRWTDPTPLKRSDIGLADDDLVLMNVGSIEPRKNQLGLIDLFAVIQGHFDRAKLVLVGDGMQRDEVSEKADEKGLREAVKFLGHRRDVAALLPLADLYVHYAALENCPMVLLEAAGASVPFAAVPAGGVPELQAALDCRIEIDHADPRSTLDRLRPLLENDALRREAGRRARAAFCRSFTRQSMVDAYLKALSFDD